MQDFMVHRSPKRDRGEILPSMHI